MLQEKQIPPLVSSPIMALLRSPSTSDITLLEPTECLAFIDAAATKGPHLALLEGPEYP